MALKFLNKKGWHTGSLRNIENVWKAEQKHEEEKKKLEEIRKHYQTERQAQELRQLQEAAGIAPRQERLEFLYDSGLATGKATADEYLLGKPLEEEKPESDFSKASSTPGALFGGNEEEKPASANEMWRKLHTDPLFLIRQQEQEARSRIRSNPVKMQMIKKEAEDHTKRKEEKRRLKEEKKRARKEEKMKRREAERQKKGKEDTDSDSSDSDRVRRREDHAKSDYGRENDRRKGEIERNRDGRLGRDRHSIENEESKQGHSQGGDGHGGRGAGRLQNGASQYSDRREDIRERKRTHSRVGEEAVHGDDPKEDGASRRGKVRERRRQSRSSSDSEMSDAPHGVKRTKGHESSDSEAENVRRASHSQQSGRDRESKYGRRQYDVRKEQDIHMAHRDSDPRMQKAGWRYEEDQKYDQWAEKRRRQGNFDSETDKYDERRHHDVRREGKSVDRKGGERGTASRQSDRPVEKEVDGRRRRHDSDSDDEPAFPVRRRDSFNENGGDRGNKTDVGEKRSREQEDLPVAEDETDGRGRDSEACNRRQADDADGESEERVRYGLYVPRGGSLSKSADRVSASVSASTVEAAPPSSGLPPRPPPRPKRGLGQLSEEERARRVAEMQADAENHEDQRWQRLKRAADKDAAEAGRAATTGEKNFLEETNQAVYGAGKGGSASIEESVRRRTHFHQKGGVERSAFKRY